MAEAVWWILLAINGLIVLRWLWGHVELTRTVRAGLLVPRAASASDKPRARVSVLVAAHNEEHTIGACLAGLREQSYADLQVIVANDRSTDNTRKIVREAAGSIPDLQCVDIAELPAGWLGKIHALSVATRHADGEWLVFTDADVRLHPETITTVIDLAESKRLDFLSLWPKVLLCGFWERLLLPACGFSLSLWFQNPRMDDVEATPVFANGQFLVMRRTAYERLGGHAAVRDELAEDVALARLAHAAGLRRYLALGRDLLQTRMYENLPQIVHGWTRIFIGALRARWKLAMTIVAILVGCLPPLMVITVLAYRSFGGSFGVLEWSWLAVAVAHGVAMYSVLYRQFALTFEGERFLPLLALGWLAVIPLLGYCLLLIGGIGTIRWGNVRYRVHGSRVVHGQAVSD